MFEKEVYIARREALKAKLAGEKGIVLLLGNVDSPIQYKSCCYKWHQDSNFMYFFGINEAGFAATIDLESGDETIYADDADLDDIIWTGPLPSVRELALGAGVERTRPSADLKADLSGRKVHFLPANRYYNALKLSELLGVRPEDNYNVGKNSSPISSKALINAIVELRIVKEEREIEQIELACNIGYEMHTLGRRGIKVGATEQSVAGLMEGLCLSKGWGASFETILTQHGEIFHGSSRDCPIEAGRLVVVDAGAETNSHYVSDFTRTYPSSGFFTSKQRDIYQTVLECNELAFSLIRPGVSYRDVNIAVGEHILDNLSTLGLVKGDPAEMTAEGIAGLFMPHGLGHNMGLDVHDMEDLGEDLVGYESDQSRSELLGLDSLRMARRLKSGNVITDEPGIYFVPALIEDWKRKGKGSGIVNFSKLEEYYDFGGIRLEDDVLVTATGARRLGSQRLPITPDEIEELAKIEK